MTELLLSAAPSSVVTPSPARPYVLEVTTEPPRCRVDATRLATEHHLSPVLCPTRPASAHDAGAEARSMASDPRRSPAANAPGIGTSEPGRD